MKRLIFTLLVIVSVCSIADAKYSGGSGDPNDPYQIADVNDLLTLAADANDYNKCFIMTADIDLDPNLPGRQVFTIAVIAPDTVYHNENFDGNAFTGIFDGAGNKIRNLTISGFKEDYLGFFGYIDATGEVKNLGLENVRITHSCDSFFLGALAGKSSGNIDNCYVTFDILFVLGGLFHHGGLVGDNGGNISNSFAKGLYTAGNVEPVICHGGLVGRNAGSITSCHSNSTIRVVDSGAETGPIGGLVGENAGNISNCYSTGDVNGLYYPCVGGLVGLNGGTISNCFSIGHITGEEPLGGLVGCGSGVSNCYFLDISGPNNGYGTPLTDEQMKQQASFIGWDFNTPIWKICESQWYPQLAWVRYDGGQGTEEEPYLIHTSCDLNDIGNYPEDLNKCFILVSDIDLGPNLPEGQVFTTAVIAPDINNANIIFDGNAFTGIFNGAGHKILNLTIDTDGAGNDYLSLFGSVNKYGFTGNSEVKNLCVEDVHVTGGDGSKHLGGLVGDNYQGGSISNCCSTGSILSGDNSSHLGGLAAHNGGNIRNCFSTCSVAAGTQSFALGGLSGSMEPGTISNSYSTGAVSAGLNSSDIGGLLGYSEGGVITNCFSTGTVAVGEDSLLFGGLVGYVDDSNTIYSSYFLDVAGPNNGYGTPLSDAQMKQQSSFVGWDFVGESANGTQDIWRMCLDGLYYPKLQWEFARNADYACPDGVNFLDYAFFAERWLDTSCADVNDCDGADIDFSDTVDTADLNIFCIYWLQGL